MSLPRTLVVVCGVLALGSCSLLQPSPQPPPPPPTIVAGFQCLSVPTEWNEPGSLFSVDQSGIAQRVGRVDGVNGKTGLAVMPTYSSTQTFGVGVFLKTLEGLTGSSGWSAQLGVDANASLTMKSSYEDVQHIITDQPPAGAVSKWFNQSYAVEDGVTYYLVRESLAAKSIDYEIKRGDLAKLGGEAQFKKIAEGKLNVLERTNNDALALKKTLDKHVNVCIKAQRQLVQASASGAKVFTSGGYEEVKVRSVRVR